MRLVMERTTTSTLDRSWAKEAAPRLRLALMEAVKVPTYLRYLCGELTCGAREIIDACDAELQVLARRAAVPEESAVWAAENVLGVAADLARDALQLCPPPPDIEEDLLRVARALERTAMCLADWHLARPRALRLAVADAAAPWAAASPGPSALPARVRVPREQLV